MKRGLAESVSGTHGLCYMRHRILDRLKEG